jgi:hypothetical protein
MAGFLLELDVKGRFIALIMSRLTLSSQLNSVIYGEMQTSTSRDPVLFS